MKPSLRIIAILTALLGFGLLNGGRAADLKGEKKPVAEKKELFKNLSVAEFEKLRADKKNVVLDVRTKKEFEAGHIPGAINIDVNTPDFKEKISKLNKNKTYLVHCAAGGRSA